MRQARNARLSVGWCSLLASPIVGQVLPVGNTCGVVAAKGWPIVLVGLLLSCSGNCRENHAKEEKDEQMLFHSRTPLIKDNCEFVEVADQTTINDRAPFSATRPMIAASG